MQQAVAEGRDFIKRPTTASQEPSQASAGGTTTNRVGQRSTSTSVKAKPKLPINFTKWLPAKGVVKGVGCEVIKKMEN